MALKLDFSKVLVKDNTNRTTKAEADILLQAELIMARVTAETFNALSNTVANHEASLSLQADAIALRVSFEDFNGETIASLINQSAAEVKIQASKIILEGLITANGNFKILADGSIEAVNAKLSGSIIATRVSATTSPYYYAEVGVSDGLPGLGLYSTQNNDTRPYMLISKLMDNVGFGLCDANRFYRFLASASSTSIADQSGIPAFSASGVMRAMYDSKGKTAFTTSVSDRYIFSPNGQSYIHVTDAGIRIVVNGVTKASW